jgi:hypothetical protein
VFLHRYGCRSSYVNNYAVVCEDTFFYISDTYIHDDIKYFSIGNVEEIGLLEEKL